MTAAPFRMRALRVLRIDARTLARGAQFEAGGGAAHRLIREGSAVLADEAADLPRLLRQLQADPTRPALAPLTR
jgi:hypothetical protein